MGLCFVPFPGTSHSGDQVFGERSHCNLSPPLSLPLSFLGVQLVHLLRCAMCLFWGVDLWLQPSWWMSTVQYPRKTWLATGDLLAVWKRMRSLGLRLPLSFWLWLSTPCLYASGGGWASLQPASSPLVFTQSFVLCEARQCLRLELLVRKFFLFLFSLSLWLSHSLGCYLTLTPSDCPQGIQARSLP